MDTEIMEQSWESTINQHIYGRLSFYKGTMAIQWRRDSLFNKWWWNKCISISKSELLLLSRTTQKIHSESITDLNAIPKTIKHPEENTRENHHEPGLGEIYWL